MVCPLCLAKGHDLEYAQGPDKREYRLCRTCKLIFTGIKYPAKRKKVDTTGKGKNPADLSVGVEKKLRDSLQAVLPYLEGKTDGLNYHSGEYFFFSKILEENGLQCDEYDPEFSPIELKESYDYIFVLDKFEEFFLPVKEISNLKKLLKEDGYLIIFTEKYKSPEQFKKWSFAKDARHVSFYHTDTINFICKKFSLNSIISDENKVIMLQRFNKPEITEISNEEALVEENLIHSGS